MAEQAIAIKETKAQKSERLKLAKNPWETWSEVREFARQGREAVLPEWANLYFKWWGIYTQGDGVGATGGVGGEGVVTEYFMMRVGIPNGILSSQQTRVIAQIAKDHGRNLADVTTRQNIQFHWLTIESLPLVVDALEKVGLSPKGACGDVVRNVTGCPLAGHDAEELFDASPIAMSVAATLTANNDFVNLPRKFKICITGCPIWCSYPEINDIALTGAMNATGEKGFALRVGGGLSKDPYLAVKLNAFVRQEQAEEVCIKIAEIFREQTVLRESRTTARLKFLFLKHGWTAESFLAALEERMGFKFDPAPKEHVPGDQYRDHTGVRKQKEAGLHSVGLSVLRGRLTGDQMQALADLAQKYGTGDLRCTIQQNVILMGVPSEFVQPLIGEITKLGLRVEGSSFWRGTVACTGTEFCKLAITETKGFAQWLVNAMEERMPEFPEQLRINVTGCPNNCGQSWISDIGLEGKKIKHDGQLVDAYYFLLGGAVGDGAAIARPIGYRVPVSEVPVAIERLLTTYMQQRQREETLRAYFKRYSNEELRGQLAGEVVAPVERDKPTGHAPSTATGAE